MSEKQTDIGLIGLAVMGSNLAMNMARNGHHVQVYNRTAEVTRQLMAGPARDSGLSPSYDLGEFCAALKRPRRIIVMVKAGAAVDAVINQLQQYLAPGDLIVDAGNSLFTDTERRWRDLTDKGFLYMGLGVSGGEEGALWGPSLMPGGSIEAYRMVEPVLQSIAAKVNGEACVTYIGEGGAGHFVKMVHNGIEYGDMQLIAEVYDLLDRGLSLSNMEISRVFSDWNRGELASYLIEITSDIFQVMDDSTGKPLVEMILDKAGQKGTGLWTVQNALNLGVSTPTINAALNGRIISGYKDQRVKAGQVLPGPDPAPPENTEEFIDDLGQALYLAKICAYAQGFDLMKTAAAENDWSLDYREIARIWRGGCIIRARLLENIRAAYAENKSLSNLLLAPSLKNAVNRGQKAMRSIVARAAQSGIPTPALSASLGYYDALRSARLPANLIQAQRDYFGAHTYARTDVEGVFHTDWAAALQKKRKDGSNA